MNWAALAAIGYTVGNIWALNSIVADPGFRRDDWRDWLSAAVVAVTWPVWPLADAIDRMDHRRG